MKLGGGVAGAILRKGGSSIQEASFQSVLEKGPVPTGSCRHTRAGELPCKYIIHTVGPYYEHY